ncbi:MAG: hypothetical protein M1822_005929 [Bathelium mastoideum]|nr:MAG: hypothetical protein M1822_005929 [Bathelium mastoideum]
MSVADDEKDRSSNSDDVDEDEHLLDNARGWARKSFYRRHWRLLLEAVLFVGLLTALAVVLLYQPPLIHRQQQCGRLLGQWLPDAEEGIDYEVQRFHGTFGLKSPYTGVGAEVDAAWDNITDGGAIGITREQWEAVNPYHEYPVMLDRDHGTGQYLASLDVFHQLHCVDLLRKNIHREYYDKHEGSFAGAPPQVIEGHLEHCVETLRQTIMCHGDISLLTYNWVEGREMPYPNFNTIHTCKKWDRLTEWNMKRDVTVEWTDGGGRKMLTPPLKPKDVKGMTTPP